MPLIILAVVIAAIGIYLLRTRKTCDWQPPASGKLWRCQTCGAETFSTSGGPPEICKRTIKSKPL